MKVILFILASCVTSSTFAHTLEAVPAGFLHEVLHALPFALAVFVSTFVFRKVRLAVKR